ncbi:LPS translocon maturation chaperone LptM [Alkanindiges illinoisensis]|uniref:Sugar transporter n=1 Tax=Alkanindiges illinoisensis TaxID=197183 RepID=A0A4Y7XFB1_9GAMM|nr:lipoprotein [Alkanindiges illinoisensis]TEU30162.1 sugar transporter [Alkanindiges illinoisensis]
MRIGFSSALLCLTALGLAACGQKGPLILPSDHAAKDSKAIYLIKPKKANGEVQPNPQTDFSDEPGTTVTN